MREEGGEVDDLAAAPGQHPRQHRPGAVQQRHDVALQDGAADRPLQLQEVFCTHSALFIIQGVGGLPGWE